jgi:hypothetical protein
LAHSGWAHSGWHTLVGHTLVGTLWLARFPKKKMLGIML